MIPKALSLVGVMLFFFVTLPNYKPVSAQYKNMEVVAEIPAEIAKYSYDEHHNIIGPSTIDVDQNGDIYIGGDKQILVYSNNGKYKRTLSFFKDFNRDIRDIAVGPDNKIFFLGSPKEVFIIDKNANKITRDKILAHYFFKSASLRRIWLTDTGKCLLGKTDDQYYLLDEADVRLHEKGTNHRRYPTYDGALAKLYTGVPLKSSHKTFSLVEKRQGINFKAEKIGEKVYENNNNPFEKYVLEPQLRSLIDIIPQHKKQKYISLHILEIFGVNTQKNLFVRSRIRRKINSVQQTPVETSQYNIAIYVITKFGQYIDTIDSIPKDAVNSIFRNGKRFSAGSDSRLYYLYTVGNENELESCITRVIRW